MSSPNPNGQIHSENLCSQAVVERVLGDESVTSIKIFNTLQSDNFSSGSAGWQIRRDTGSAEFQDITARGAITATSGELQTLSVTGTLTLSGSALIKSSNYVAATSGWQIEADGDAEFNDVTVRGTIVATAGSISDLTIAGDLTMNSSGRILTDSGTSRVELVYAALAGESDGIPSILWRMNNTVGGKIQIQDATPDNFLIESDNGANLQMTSDGDMFLFTTGGDLYLGGAGTAYYNFIHVDQAGDRIRFYTGASTETETFRVREDAGNNQALTADGSASAPGLAFLSDGNTGFFRQDADKIGISTNGTERFRISDVVLTARGGTGAARIIYAAGTVSAPAYSFVDDADTGLYRATANEVGLTAGGAEMFTGLNTTNDEVRILPAYATTGSGDDTVGVTSTGLLRRQTSAARYKQQIKDADHLADIILRPVSYWTKPLPNSREIDEQSIQLYGLVADEIADQDPIAARFNPESGEVENYYDRAVLAILVAKINRLEERLANVG